MAGEGLPECGEGGFAIAVARSDEFPLKVAVRKILAEAQGDTLSLL